MIGRHWLRRMVTVSGLGMAVACVAGLVLMTVRTSVRLTTPPGYVHPYHEQQANGQAVSASTWIFGDDPRERFGLTFQDVSFPTADGSTLRGWLVPGSGDGADANRGIGIVAAHARGGDRRGYLEHLPSFHARGFTTLLFDFREHGMSDGAGRGMSLGQHEAEDISAAVRFLKESQHLQHVGIIGHSLGGSSVILAAAQDSQIDAVVAESSIASFDAYVGDMTEQWVEQRRVPSLRPLWQGWWPRMVVDLSARRMQLDEVRAPIDVISQIAPRPLLLIHGTHDDVVAPSHSERLLAEAGEPRDLWLVPDVTHSTSYTAFPPEYFGRVVGFFSAALR
jgi:dipeptidyl aminopeptidase/acylaminoacyl peptidase